MHDCRYCQLELLVACIENNIANSLDSGIIMERWHKLIGREYN